MAIEVNVRECFGCTSCSRTLRRAWRCRHFAEGRSGYERTIEVELNNGMIVLLRQMLRVSQAAEYCLQRNCLHFWVTTALAVVGEVILICGVL